MRTLVALAVLSALAGAVERGRHRTDDSAAPPSPSASIRFEENRGQSDPSVRFVVRARGYTGFLTDRGLVLSLAEGRTSGRRRAGLSMEFVGGAARPAGAGVLPGSSSYFIGSDAARWIRSTPSFGKAVSRGVWPGIDAEWTGDRGHVRYSFRAAPGADPARVALRFAGADSLRVDERGDLVVGSPFGVTRHLRPVAWQESAGARVPVEASFAVRSPGVVGFDLGPVDPRLPLVIDPVIEYSTYLGAAGQDELVSIATDAAGAIYLVGNTQDSVLPVVGGVRGSLQNVSYEIYVAKLNPGGATLAYATYLGGTLEDYCSAIKVDSSGRAWITGWTFSSDFPTAAAFQSTLKGYYNAVVVRLSAAGDALQISSYFGGAIYGTSGAAGTLANSLALDATGDAYIVGTTEATDLPTKDPFQPSIGGGSYDAFIAKFTSAGALVYASYLGGRQTEDGLSVAVDGQGRAYVVGDTYMSGFPSVNPIAGISGAAYDGFLARVAADGKSLDYAFPWGGTASETPRAVALGPAGEVFVAGTTSSTNFPVKNPLMTFGFNQTAGFLMRFSGDGTVLQYSTLLASIGAFRVYALAVDSAGGAWLAGDTGSFGNFPLVLAVQSIQGGQLDAFLLHLNASGSSVRFSTLLGGSGTDSARALALDGDGTAICGGYTTSSNFPTVSALDSSFGGGGTDGFLARITTGPAAPTSCVAAAFTGTAASVSWTDASADETGFTVQRREPPGAFAAVGSVGANVTSFADVGLAPLTAYEYRVQSFSDAAGSAWSNVATTTTPDVAPASPALVSAVPLSTSSVRLTWTDKSANETSYEVLYGFPGTTHTVVAGLAAGSTTYDVTGLLPGRTYGFTARGRNDIGAGASPPDRLATTDPTASFVLVKGTLKASTKTLKDKFTVSGTLVAGVDSPDGSFDPVADGIVFRLGGELTPLASITIPAASAGWKERKGKFTWKSAKGIAPKAVVTFTPATGAFTVNLSKVEFAGPVAAALPAWFATGNDAGTGGADWQEAKPGSWRFPAK